MPGKSTARKHQKHNKRAFTDIQEKPVDFFNNTARVSALVPKIIFASLGSFAKVSVPVGSVIPC